MKKLAKKQPGGSVGRTGYKVQVGSIKPFKSESERKAAIERMKPSGKQTKFDPSKVSTNGAILKNAPKVGSTYVKRKGGSVKSKKK